MTIPRLDRCESTGASPAGVVVCVAVHETKPRLDACLDSVVSHTNAAVPIIVCDALTGSLGAYERDELAKFGRRLRFADIDDALEIAAPADVVLLSSDCRVADGWLEGLRMAALSDSRVATACALMDGGVGVAFDAAAAAVRASSLRLRPRLDAARAGCMYIRRSAMELTGLATLRRDRIDRFGRTCIGLGLCHVLADDVLVLDVSDDADAPLQRHDRRVDRLARAYSAAHRALDGVAVAIDARILAGPTTGTHLQVLEVIAALARDSRVTLTAVVPDDPTPSAARILGSLSAVTVVRHGEAARRMGARADVVHRPCRINSPGDLSLLASLGDRLVITQEDLIGFHNPSYFEDADGWLGHRTLTRLSLALADHVVCVSGHARADALTEQLVEPSRASVVHNGVDHGLAGGLAPPSRPSRAAALPDQAEALLCLGTDYRHKNRLFALRILEQLQARHGWSGYLVFAGPHVALGSSRLDEVRWLTAHPASANRVIDCLAVSEGEKAWLFERSKLVLYPTTFEGFGLVPFEAAQRGVPCAWAPGTSLSEVLPDAAATLLPWDAAECADRVFALIRDRHVRERHLEAVRTAGAGLTWDAAAGRLIDLYNAVCDAPPPPLSALERSDGLMSGAVSQDAMQLFGPGGALPRDLERPLLALASHPRLAKPVLGAMKLGYRTTFTLRRLRQSQRPT